MSYTTITSANVGLADGDSTPQPLDGSVRITPRFPSASTDSGFIATGPVIVPVSGGTMGQTEIPALEGATGKVEFHLHDRATGPAWMPSTEIPLEPGTTIRLGDYMPTGVDSTEQGILRGPRGYTVSEVSQANGELTLTWEDGRADSITMPDAVQGVGVAEATQPYEGGLAFDLTDGTSTSAVSLPAGPRGADGANVLPGRTAVLSEAWQPDFVETARQRSPYKTMTLTTQSGGGLLIQCRTGVEEGHLDDRITYEVTGGDNYRIIGAITEASAQRGEFYTPDPTDTSYAEGDVRLSDGTTVITGDWATSSTWFTTEIGATWEVPITTHNPGDEIFLSLFLDDRGGVWRMSLVEDESVTGDVSTFSTVDYGATPNLRAFSVPTPGDYTLRGTFMGDDPDNPPSDGTSRGWLTTELNTYYLVRAALNHVGEATLSPTPSNKNFAFRIAHPEGGDSQFIPDHGHDVETLMGPAEFYDGPRKIDVDSLTPGVPIEVGELTMVQHFLGHNPYDVTDELADVRTVDTIMADGTYRAEGRIEALRDLIIASTSYTGMLPFNPNELNLVATSLRTTYPAPPEDLPNEPLGADGLHSTSVAVVGDDPALVAAVRFNQPEETRRLSLNESSDPIFIQHRNEDMGKIYPRIGYAGDTLAPAGTVWRFSADYWLGRSPGIRHLIE